MEIQNKKIYVPSFRAKPGKHLIAYFSKNEFNADKSKIEKFEKLFSDAFANITDEETIIDINKKNNLIFSHFAFPNTKYCYKDSHAREISVRSILNECSKTIATGESKLFQHIIRSEIERGKSFEELKKIIETLIHEPKKFLKTLYIAGRIKLKDPNSKLNNYEFNIMDMEIAEEYLQNNKSKSIKEILAGLKNL